MAKKVVSRHVPLPPMSDITVSCERGSNGVLSSPSPQVAGITQHPDYSFPLPLHDLAVLTLSKNVLWDARVSPVCLPRGALDERMAELAGWG